MTPPVPYFAATTSVEQKPAASFWGAPLGGWQALRQKPLSPAPLPKEREVCG
jgi:hypothetical protein